MNRNEYGYPINPSIIPQASHKHPTDPTDVPPADWPREPEAPATQDEHEYDVWGLPVGMPL